MDLLLYDHVDAAEPAQTVELVPSRNRTHDYWHVFVPGLQAGQIYAYRAHGPEDSKDAHHFDGDKVLLDPYGRAVAMPKEHNRKMASRPGRNDRYACKSVVVDARGYRWEGDAPLRRPFSQTIIYEMHVRGFTQHESSGVAPHLRGTYAGVVEKIPYLLDLGITAVELMPVFQFDPQDSPSELPNYWGYAPMSFFAPHVGYSASSNASGVLDEFRDMVKALHCAGIEVILDVVYNHTAEGGADGPTYSLRGLDNSNYYLMDGGAFANYSGTGNALNANRAVVRRLILDSLHYWVEVMHVDGFRFDLASILSRDSDGTPMPNPPLLWDIDSDPVLAGAKLIVEAWDAGGLYQVGSFVGNYWKEWNGKFRDDVRAFVRGDEGMAGIIASRLIGSPDLYSGEIREPEQSINFVTAHDGFTLNDLVSYNQKHNLDNGEDNHDGNSESLSHNWGVEGPSDDSEIESMRVRQIRNLLAITLLSLGAPMLTMGDECRRTQRGNNNAYCQDNEISWMDWRLVEEHADLRRFVRQLIALRSLRDAVRGGQNVPLALLHRLAKIRFHGVALDTPDWSQASRSLALSASNISGEVNMYYALNMYWEALDFEIPETPPGSSWRQVIDTSLDSPNEIADDIASAPIVATSHYRVEPRSLVALVAFASKLPS